MLALAENAPARAALARPPAPVVFDLSRLISRARHGTPTGIDRVDLAYARALLAEGKRRVGFSADVRGLGQQRLSRAAVARFVETTAARWACAGGTLPAGLRANPALGLLRGLGPAEAMPANAIELVVAHQRLDKPTRLRRQLQRSGTRLVAFIHDAIPCEFPEYARAESAERHHVRLVTAARLARGLIVNSEATAAALAPWLTGMEGQQLLVAPLGIEARPPLPPQEAAARPYFVCLGTIEPRKNHLLLLNVWRRLTETLPAAEVPRLVIIGRRGWENENIVDMLDRCPALKGVVEELSGVDDQRLSALVAGARAVLMPSFAEGFGLPVGEALAQGTPVLASDLPALRETGGAVPEYLDPIDGPGWAAAITDYARPDSQRRQQQLERLQHWSPPRWDQHFERVFAFLDGLPS
jgi:glycosyltransferase involved in cell wall biosynthesis